LLKPCSLVVHVTYTHTTESQRRIIIHTSSNNFIGKTASTLLLAVDTHFLQQL
jgi:hypothetical protein